MARQNGSAGKLSRTTSCLDSDLRTYHAYHAYHALFLSDLSRIPRISRTISVGYSCIIQEAKYTHNFKHRLKQRDLAARRLQPRAQIFVRTLWPLPVVQESRDMSRRWVEVCALSALCALWVEVCALSALCALWVEVCALSALCAPLFMAAS